MARTITRSIHDSAVTGSAIRFHQDEAGDLRAGIVMDVRGSDGSTDRLFVDRTLVELVSDGIITGAQRTTLVSLLLRIATGVRLSASLDP